MRQRMAGSRSVSFPEVSIACFESEKTDGNYMDALEEDGYPETGRYGISFLGNDAVCTTARDTRSRIQELQWVLSARIPSFLNSLYNHKYKQDCGSSKRAAILFFFCSLKQNYQDVYFR